MKKIKNNQIIYEQHKLLIIFASEKQNPPLQYIKRYLRQYFQ